MRSSPGAAVPAAVLALLLSAILAACGGSAVPPIPPGDSPSAGVPPSGGSQPSVVRITAVDILFDPAAVTVPAGRPFTIQFDNRDEGIPHDIVVKDESGNQIVASAIITGLAQERLEVAALAPGVYPFVCTIHPNMVGQITAE